MNKERTEYYIYVKNNPVQVTKAMYKTYWKSVERERTLDEKRDDQDSFDDVLEGYGVSKYENKYLRFTNPTENTVNEHFLYEALRVAIQNLSSDEKELIELFFYENLKEEDISRKLGVHQSTISKKKNKILKKLRLELDEWESMF